jgi:hypothetical protein
VVVPAGVLEAAELELMSVALPVEPVVPEAPIEVPLPVVLEPLAVVSVLGVAGVVTLLLLAEVLVSDGRGVDGAVLDVVEEEVDVSAGVVTLVSSLLPQALRDRAASRARAAHCAVGDLIIRNSLGFVSKCIECELTAAGAACGSL